MGDYLQHPGAYLILTAEYYKNALLRTSARDTGYRVFCQEPR